MGVRVDRTKEKILARVKKTGFCTRACTSSMNIDKSVATRHLADLVKSGVLDIDIAKSTGTARYTARPRGLMLEKWVPDNTIPLGRYFP